MIYATGGPSKNCDGISRRSFLSAGTLGLGSFGLADLLRAESLNKTGSSNKSIIHITNCSTYYKRYYYFDNNPKSNLIKFELIT